MRLTSSAIRFLPFFSHRFLPPFLPSFVLLFFLPSISPSCTFFYSLTAQQSNNETTQQCNTKKQKQRQTTTTTLKTATTENNNSKNNKNNKQRADKQDSRLPHETASSLPQADLPPTQYRRQEGTGNMNILNYIENFVKLLNSFIYY